MKTHSTWSAFWTRLWGILKVKRSTDKNSLIKIYRFTVFTGFFLTVFYRFTVSTVKIYLPFTVLLKTNRRQPWCKHKIPAARENGESAPLLFYNKTADGIVAAEDGGASKKAAPNCPKTQLVTVTFVVSISAHSCCCSHQFFPLWLVHWILFRSNQ